MTHDLLKTVLMGLNTGVKKVVVNELKDDTFYAIIWLEKDGELISVDSRPSDALALALASIAPSTWTIPCSRIRRAPLPLPIKYRAKN